ncbi:MAG: hypothetical protein NVSMB42_01890 [Herpetosiphon sp.]
MPPAVRYAHPRHLVLVLILTWASLNGALAAPAQQTMPPAHPTQAGLGSVLNPDGTLNIKAGLGQSFDASGYRLATAPNGQPRFVPATTLQAAGDENWDDRFGFPGVNYAVKAIAVDPGTQDVYVGGDFTTAGMLTVNGIARWDGRRWNTLSNGLGNAYGGSGTVNSIATKNGKVYVAGSFSNAGRDSKGNGGIVATGIAQWDGTSWAPLGNGTGAQQSSSATPVNAVSTVGNDVYIGGAFDSVDNVPARRIARWDGAAWSEVAGGISTCFGSPCTSGSGEVKVLAADGNGGLYAGGNFNTAGTTPASSIAHLVGTVWQPMGTGIMANGGPGTVNALAVDGASVYVGGEFAKAGGSSAKRIARWDNAAQTWSPLGAGVGGSSYTAPVSSIVINAGRVYAGGGFMSAGSVTVKNLAQWDGKAWSDVGGGVSNANAGVNALAIGPAAGLLVGGDFDTAGTTLVNHIGVFTANSWHAFGQGIAYAPGNLGTVYAITVAGDGTVYAGGLFGFAAGTPSVDIARWDGTAWIDLGSTDAQVFALTNDGVNVYAGGAFTKVAAISASHIAKYSPATGTWSALGSGTNDNVRALAFGGGYVYAGGSFSAAGTTAAKNIARWDGTNWAPLGTTFTTNGSVGAILVLGKFVLIGGQFRDLIQQTGGGTTAAVNSIVLWNSTADKWSALGPVATPGVTRKGTFDDYRGTINAIAVLDATLYVGGDFDKAGGVAAHSVAALDIPTNTWSSLGDSVGGTTGAVVNALTTIGTTLYVGGNFAVAGTADAQNIARWDTRAKTWSPLGSGLAGAYFASSTAAYALAAGGASLYVGGEFGTAGGKAAAGFARFGAQNAAPITVAAGGTLTTPDGIVITIPPRAVPNNALLTFLFEPMLRHQLPGAAINPLGLAPMGQKPVYGFVLNAVTVDGFPNTQLAQPATISIPYTDAQLRDAGVTASSLSLLVFDGTQYVALPGNVDTASHLLTITTTQLGEFALVGNASPTPPPPGRSIFLPHVQR